MVSSVYFYCFGSMKSDSPTKANINATQSETDVRRMHGDGSVKVNGNGHDALDLAETVSKFAPHDMVVIDTLPF